MKKGNDKSRLNTEEVKDKKRNTLDSNLHYEGQYLTLTAFRSGIFPIKDKQQRALEILSPKQMLERLPIFLAQVKGVNTSKNLLNDNRWII